MTMILHQVIAVLGQALTWLDHSRHLLPLGIVGVLSWSVWIIRVTLSKLYRPVPPGYKTTTSVVVPAYREDPDILMKCLRTWLAEDPTEVIIVPDLEDREVIERLGMVTDPRLRVIPFAHQGKRSALGVGMRAAKSEIIVLSDSDTQWEPGLIDAVVAPFVDPSVGGVGTRQNAFQPESSVWRRLANWMIDIRYLDYVPSQSRAGAVACLSGRTAAYRRSAVLPVLSHMEHEFFLGRLCISGDDGRLTWLVLAAGYKTVHQSTARTLSMFPDRLRPFLKQRVRWSRNSYRCYLTAMWKGWLWRRPLITQLTVLQFMLTPLTMGIAMVYLAHWIFHPQQIVATVALSWLLVGRAIRGLSHLRERPRDIFVLPLLALLTVCIALFVKTFAIVTMNRQGWLTRHTDLIGGEAQNAATLTEEPALG
jgi:cellulose synthase/poly-beta-1,6-N-acetylglucosamine synthase-like glycosyltransferase